jgi:two-component sensor histidine kinase
LKAEPHALMSDRLKALESFQILDTGPEPEFDDVVQLASAICGTPVSLVSLIDKDRQWFKAELGFGQPETDLNSSICAHAILHGDFLEIEDTSTDPRSADNPLVAGEPRVRFYAGAVLKTDDGVPLGSLCVLDYTPRKLTELQRQTLRVLAAQVMAQLKLRRSLGEMQVLRQEVDHRVKNSLQTLSSLISIQRRQAKSPEVKQALETVDQRVRSIAQMHEMLYQTSMGDQVDAAAYIHKLIQLYAESAPDQIHWHLSLAPVMVSPKHAGALGTMLSELSSNAVKYAFPDGRPGQIRISLAQGRDGMAQLDFSDDGIGMDPDEKPRGSGLGTSIIAAASQQLGGSITQNADRGGVAVTLTFQPDTDVA